MRAPTKLHGFGAIVEPEAPYRIGRVDGEPETTLRIVHGAGTTVIDVAAILREDATTDLADITAGDPMERWRIETTDATCAWPEGFDLASDPDDLSPFLLLGPDDSMVWLAGPVDRATVEPIENLAGEGQRVRAVAEAGDHERIDLDYEADDEAWWQRKYVVPWDDGQAIVITGQARSAMEELTALAVDLVERSLEPHRSAE